MFSLSLKDRIRRLKRYLRNMDGVLITRIHNVRYLTGFTGSAGYVLLTREGGFFITDFRYKEQAHHEVQGMEVLIVNGLMSAVRKLIKQTDIKILGFESLAAYEFYNQLSKTGVKLKPVKELVEKMRSIKDDYEIGLIKEAVRRAEGALNDVLPTIKVGVRERTVALRLEERLKKHGCISLPFDIIVASGPNSAMPHAKVTERKIEAGDFLLVDWGGEAEGYFSDMTRTFLMRGGNDTARKKEIYNLVLEANRKGIEAVQIKKPASEVDQEARDVIKKAGYGDNFGHSLGHGVGIEVHEKPNISRRAREKLKTNMVITIEPGIYIPEVGGVRIEDMVIPRPEGVEVLTSLPKELKIL